MFVWWINCSISQICWARVAREGFGDGGLGKGNLGRSVSVRGRKSLPAAVMADAWLSSILWVSEACLRSFGRISEEGVPFGEGDIRSSQFTYWTVPAVPGRRRCWRRIPAGRIGVELLVDGFDNNLGVFRVQNPLLVKELLETALTSPLSGVKVARESFGSNRMCQFFVEIYCLWH